MGQTRARTAPEKRPKGKVPEPENLWDRYPDETDSAWGNFLVYRAMEPVDRSIVKAAIKAGRNPSTFEAHSQRYSWVVRVRAYDQWRDRQAQMAEIEAVQEMKKRHIQMAMSFQGAAALALNKIIAAEQQKGKDGKPGALTLKPTEVKELAELGMKIERLNRGEPESIQEQKVELLASDRRTELRRLLEDEKAAPSVRALTETLLDGSPTKK